MNILQEKNAIIFDMDGTIIDSMWVWKQIDIEFLAKRNITMPETLQKDIEGMSFHETAVYFKNKFNLSEDLEEIKNIWNDMAYEKYANDIKLKDGVKEFLCKLKESGLKLGIATSNCRKLTTVCLTNLNIIDLFDCILTGDEIINGKPQPDIYLTVAERLDVSCDKCLVFEDVLMGILAGNNANMTTCAVYDDFTAHLTDEKKELAHFYADSFKDIINNDFCLI